MVSRGNLVVGLLVSLSVGTLAHGGYLGGELALSVASQFVDRGEDIHGGARWPVHPSLTVGLEKHGLSASIWGCWATSDRATTSLCDQLDFSIDFSHDLTRTSAFSLGGTYSCFPNDTEAGSLEVYAGMSCAVVGSPGIIVFYDTKLLDERGHQADGWYISLEAGHSLSTGWRTFDLGASLGIASNDNFDGFQDLNVSVSTHIPAGPITFSPFLTGTFILEDSVNDDVYELWGGLSMSLGF